jgi:hypothetical protein
LKFEPVDKHGAKGGQRYHRKMLFRCTIFEESETGDWSVQCIHEYEFSDPSEALAHFGGLAKGAAAFTVEDAHGSGQWRFKKANDGWRRIDA